MKRTLLTQAAIVCEHVALRCGAVQRAVRSDPAAEEDSGWQFLCGEREAEDEKKAAVWSVQEVVDYEPSLASWIDSDIGTVIERSSHHVSWRKMA